MAAGFGCQIEPALTNMCHSRQLAATISEVKAVPEAKRSERARSLLGAKIIFNNRMSIIDCVVKNISSSGAKLALASSLAVPGEFELHVPQKGFTCNARKVWQDNEGIGVEFGQPVESNSAENARLREYIRVLTNRLAGLGHDPGSPA